MGPSPLRASSDWLLWTGLVAFGAVLLYQTKQSQPEEPATCTLDDHTKQLDLIEDDDHDRIARKLKSKHQIDCHALYNLTKCSNYSISHLARSVLQVEYVLNQSMYREYRRFLRFDKPFPQGRTLQEVIDRIQNLTLAVGHFIPDINGRAETLMEMMQGL